MRKKKNMKSTLKMTSTTSLVEQLNNDNTSGKLKLQIGNELTKRSKHTFTPASMQEVERLMAVRKNQTQAVLDHLETK